MLKYYCVFERAPEAGMTADDCVYRIYEYDTTNGERIIHGMYGDQIFIYHSTLIVGKLFESVDDAIKDLGWSRRLTILPDGSMIIPEAVNYPNLYDSVFQAWNPNVQEIWPGEPGWGLQG